MPPMKYVGNEITGETIADISNIARLYSKDEYIAQFNEMVIEAKESCSKDGFEIEFDDVLEYYGIDENVVLITGEQGVQGAKGVQGERGNDGVGIQVKPDSGMCTEAGDAYIDENGHIQIYLGDGKFADGGEVRGPQGPKGDPGLPDAEALSAETIGLLVAPGMSLNDAIYRNTEIKIGTNYITLDSINANKISGETINTKVVYSNDGYFEMSDENLKEFIEDFNINIDLLNKIPIKYYYWKGNKKERYLGTSAQEIRKICPELVSENENGYLTVAYDKLSLIAIASLKLLNKEINDCKKEIAKIKELLEKK